MQIVNTIQDLVAIKRWLLTQYTCGFGFQHSYFPDQSEGETDYCLCYPDALKELVYIFRLIGLYLYNYYINFNCFVIPSCLPYNNPYWDYRVETRDDLVRAQTNIITNCLNAMFIKI